MCICLFWEDLVAKDKKQGVIKSSVFKWIHVLDKIRLSLCKSYEWLIQVVAAAEHQVNQG